LCRRTFHYRCAQTDRAVFCGAGCRVYCFEHRSVAETELSSSPLGALLFESVYLLIGWFDLQCFHRVQSFFRPILVNNWFSSCVREALNDVQRFHLSKRLQSSTYCFHHVYVKHSRMFNACIPHPVHVHPSSSCRCRVDCVGGLDLQGRYAVDQGMVAGVFV
jgi:hypothetical protein